MKLAEGCCSSVSPCNHQKRDPATICDICQQAHRVSVNGLGGPARGEIVYPSNDCADQIGFYPAVALRSEGDRVEVVSLPDNMRANEQKMKKKYVILRDEEKAP